MEGFLWHAADLQGVPVQACATSAMRTSSAASGAAGCNTAAACSTAPTARITCAGHPETHRALHACCAAWIRSLQTVSVPNTSSLPANGCHLNDIIFFTITSMPLSNGANRMTANMIPHDGHGHVQHMGRM